MNSNGNIQKTEIGTFPADWQIQKLGDLVQNGRTIRYGVVQPGAFVSDGCIMLRSQDYSKGWADPASAYRISNAIANQYRNAQLKENDLILTVVGANTGQVAVAPRWLDGAVLSRSTSRIAIDVDRVDSRFCKFIIQSPTVQRQILDNLKEGAQPVISCQDVADFLVPVPPKEEQRAIAEALSDVDALINALDALITKKRHIKQGTMQQLLTGKKRLPGFELTKEFKQTEVGVVPKDWTANALRAFIKLQGGYAFRSSNFSTSGVPVIRISDIQSGFASVSECTCHPEFAIPAEFIVEKNDVLIAMSGATTGKIGVFKHEKNAYQNQRVGRFVIRNNDETSQSFVSHLVASKLFLIQLGVYLEQGAQPNISGSQIESLEFAFPPRTEQIAIAEVLSDMDAEITALEQKRDKTKLIKQGMMQELLTGKTRLI